MTAERGVIVCRIAEQRPLPGGHVALPWQDFPAWLDANLAADRV